MLQLTSNKTSNSAIFYVVCMILWAVNFSNGQPKKTDFTLQKIDSLYLEDQLFFAVFFNNVISEKEIPNLNQQLSYGIETGFIKDIPLNKNRNFGLGIGLAYGYQQINTNLFNVDFLKKNMGNQIIKNSLHSIELPIEIRWRTSTPTKYKFWRAYTGIKFNYIFSNNIAENIAPILNRFHLIATTSLGNGLINFRVSYYLTPLLKKDAAQNPQNIQTNLWQIGLIFFGL